MKKLLLKSIAILYFATCFCALFTTNSMAYIDPSVMTYAIQAGAGIAIAIGAAIGMYWRKAKKKINKKLNIDENRNKEVESDEIIMAKKEDEETITK